MGRRRTSARWRDRRNSIPAKRRRRRAHRRDVQRGAEYEPVPVYGSIARRAVHNRLGLAIVALSIAMFCVLAVFVWPQTYFGLAALGAFGFCSLNLALAALLSARREESVHRLAHELGEVPPLLESDLAPSGADGSV